MTTTDLADSEAVNWFVKCLQAQRLLAEVIEEAAHRDDRSSMIDVGLESEAVDDLFADLVVMPLIESHPSADILMALLTATGLYESLMDIHDRLVAEGELEDLGNDQFRATDKLRQRLTDGDERDGGPQQ